MAKTESKTRIRSLLVRNMTYRRWFVGDSVSALGGSMTTMAVPLLLITTTGSTATAGVVVSVASLVGILMLTPAGILADTVDRKRIALTCSVIGFAMFAVLCASVATDYWVLWVTVLIVPLLAANSAFREASIDAMLKTIVTAADFPRAVALVEGRSAAISLAGAPLGGFLFSLGRLWPFLGSLFSNLVTLYSVATLNGDFSPFAKSGKDSAGKRSRKEIIEFAMAGFKTIGQSAALPALISAVMLVNLAFSGILATLVYDWALTGVSPVLIGLLSTGSAGGVLIGSLFAGRVIERYSAGRVAIVALILAATGAAVIALFEQAIIGLIAVLLTSIGSPLMNAVVGGYMAATVSKELQGRVQSAVSLVASSIMPLAPLIAGFGLAFLEARILLAGFALLGTAAVFIALSSRAVRSLPPASQWAGGGASP